MPKKKQAQDFLPLRPAYFHILLSLSDGPVHGYGIRRDVEDRTDGRIILARAHELVDYATIPVLHAVAYTLGLNARNGRQQKTAE